MSIHLSVDDLIAYTDWERQSWRDWFRQRGDNVLEIAVGPHGDGRFAILGDLIRHIFSAEKRYVERLSGQPLTDTAALPNRDAEALFQFGEQSRKALRDLLAAFPTDAWDKPRDFKILDFEIATTPKKIVAHILMHEIRHWAQIATLLRLNGMPGEWHDFLGSPVWGETVRRAAQVDRT
ncbi:MAG TPA: DinB family protein [Bryobacteraceae bacterium]|jgi:uncharacterized damage-inducible protein DinB